MPYYVVKIKADVTLANWALEELEDVVYDTFTKRFESSIETDNEGIGVTDVVASYN